MASWLRRQNHSSDDRNDYFGDCCGKYDFECEYCDVIIFTQVRSYWYRVDSL
jgi:hypothetical protein